MKTAFEEWILKSKELNKIEYYIDDLKDIKSKLKNKTSKVSKMDIDTCREYHSFLIENSIEPYCSEFRVNIIEAIDKTISSMKEGKIKTRKEVKRLEKKWREDNKKNIEMEKVEI